MPTRRGHWVQRLLGVLVATLGSGGWAQGSEYITKLLAPGGAGGDNFGRAVAISGGNALISADRDSGAVFCYRPDGLGAWSHAQTINGLPTGARDLGSALAIDGTSALLGDNLCDDYAFNAGGAFLYTHGGTAWSLVSSIYSTDPADGGAAADQLGRSVALQGGQVLLGAPFDGNDASKVGAVFIGSAGNLTKLVPFDGAVGDYFGWSVAIHGNHALVGSYMNDGNGVDGGAVYAYEKVGGNWTFKAKFAGLDSGPADEFGYSIAMTDDTAVIGAYGYDLPGSASCGAAYVFRRDGLGNWVQADLLTASDAATGAHSGMSVAISGDLILVGSPIAANGAAYLFQDDGTGNWEQIEKITAADGAQSDRFGAAVALDGTIALIGAIYDDDLGGSSGSAYLYRVPEPGTMALLALAGIALIRRRRA